MLIKSITNQLQNSSFRQHNNWEQLSKQHFYNKLHAVQINQLTKLKIASPKCSDVSHSSCKKSNGHLTLVFTSVVIKDVIKAVQHVNKLLMNLSSWFMTRHLKNQHVYQSHINHSVAHKNCYAALVICPQIRYSETNNVWRNGVPKERASRTLPVPASAAPGTKVQEEIIIRASSRSAIQGSSLERRKRSCVVRAQGAVAQLRSDPRLPTASNNTLNNKKKNYGPFCFDALASKHQYARVFSDCAQQFGIKNITKTIQKAPQSTSIFTVIRAAFVFKKTREQFGITKNCYYIKIAIQSKAQQNMLLQCLSLLKLPAEVKVISYY